MVGGAAPAPPFRTRVTAMPRRAPPLPVLALAALALGACSAATAPSPLRSSVLLTQRPPPPGRACRVAPLPDTLPLAAAIVDVPALVADLEGYRRARSLAPGYAIVSVAFDRNGWNARRSVIEHDLPPAVADSVQRLVFAHRRTVAPGEEWGVRLRIDLGAGVGLRVGRREECAARAHRLPGFTDVRDLGIGGSAAAFAGAAGTLWVRVLVDERGEVAAATLERTAVPSRTEGFLMNRLHMMTFDPALVDGAPVASWVRVPVAPR